MSKKLLLILLCLLTFNINIVYAEELTNEEITNSPSLITNNEELTDDGITKEESEDSTEVTTTGEDYTYINEEKGYKATIDDQANLLTDEEKASLLEEMKDLTKYGNAIFASSNTPNPNVDQYARSYYHERFSTASGTLFMIDMYNRKIAVFSDGENYKTITKSKALSITDNVYKYASVENYYGCASFAFQDIYRLLEGKKIVEPMRYTSIAFLSIILAFFLSFLYVLANTRIKKATPEDILKNCNIEYKIGEVTAEKTGQRKVYIPPPDVSGGGGFSSGGDFSSGGGGGFSGGGGGFSGGGSSGGGGSHSF